MKLYKFIPARIAVIACLAAGLLSACETMEEMNPFGNMPIIGNPITYPCPEVVVAPGADRFTTYQDTRVRKIIDVIVDSEMMVGRTKCDWDLDSETAAGMLEMSVVPEFEAYRGRANKDGLIEVPYFVSLLDGENNPISKQTFVFKHKFPGSGRKALFVDAPVLLNIPIKGGQTNKDFRIFIGFQLTKEQWLDNQRRLKEELQ